MDIRGWFWFFLTPGVTRQRAPDGLVESGLGLGVILRADLTLLAINLQLEQLFLHRFQQQRITVASRCGRLPEVGEIGGCLSRINCAGPMLLPLPSRVADGYLISKPRTRLPSPAPARMPRECRRDTRAEGRARQSEHPVRHPDDCRSLRLAIRPWLLRRSRRLFRWTVRPAGLQPETLPCPQRGS